MPTLLTGSSSSSQASATVPLASKLGASRVQVVLLGKSGVGKTSLAQRLLGKDSDPTPSAPKHLSPVTAASAVSSSPTPTMGVDFATRTVCLDANAPVRLHLWDTSGEERFRELEEVHLRSLEDHDAIVFAYAVSDADSFTKACEHVQRARSLAKGSPVVALIATKADLLRRQVTAEEGRAKAQELGASLFAEVSCAADTSSAMADVLYTRHDVDSRFLRPLLRECRDRRTQVAARAPQGEAADAAQPTGARAASTAGAFGGGRAAQKPPPSAFALTANAVRRCLRCMP